MIRIIVGPWYFFPKYMAAVNGHSGTIAYFYESSNSDWVISCAQCPAQWMLEELGNWFMKWIQGK